MGQASSEFDSFLKQERADADEKLNIKRIDPSTPVDRAIAFIDAIQSNVKGRETDISTMRGDLRVFRWERQTVERLWLRASANLIVVELDDDAGNVAITFKQYPREEGSRVGREPAEVPGLMQKIDVSKLAPAAIRQRATELLIDFLKAAYA